MEPEDGLEQVREPLERDVLIGAEVRGEAMMLGSKDTGAFTFSGNLPLQQWPQELFTRIWRCPVTAAMIGSGMPTTGLVAAIVADSMSSGLPHTGQTAAGYRRSVPVTSPDCGRVMP